MPTITNKQQFDAALEAVGIDPEQEPRVERDIEYSYSCYDDADGNEVGFISHRDGEIVGYTFHKVG